MQIGMETADHNVRANDIRNNIKNGVDETSHSHEKRSSAMTNVNVYQPLNSFDTDESGGQPRRTLFGINRKALLSFLAVAVVSLSVVILTVVFVVKNDSGKHSTSTKERRNDNRYGFADIFDRKFSADIPEETWISDDSLLRVEGGNVREFNVKTNKRETLLSQKILGYWRIDASNCNKLSPDGKWILCAIDKEQKYRYSSVAKYYAVNKDTHVAVKIRISSASEAMSPIEYISWGESQNSLVFVSNHDIYWIESVERPDAIRVTFTGKEKILFNGIPDWVYEEEILAKRPPLVVSPDDKHLSYASFNDTEVPLFKIALYGKPPTAYTRIQDIAYPKPGTANPVVRIYVYDVKKRAEIELQPPAVMKDRDHYFTNLVWADSQTVSVTWMNREQTMSIVMLCNVDSGDCIENYKLVVNQGWVNQDYNDPLFSSDGSFYIQLLPRNEGEDAGDFLHIAKVPATQKANKDVKFLTWGRWEVKKIASFDQTRGIVYYTGSEESPINAHLYSVDLTGKRTCISCNLKESKEQSRNKLCTNYDSSFSKKCSWYILTCSGPRVPISWIRSTQDSTVTLLESNGVLQKLLETTKLPSYEYYKIKTTDQKYDIQVRETRPPNFSEKKKYAVLFNVYGGPSSQEISDTYQTGFHTYLTSNYDIIVCEVDGRGTASKGAKFRYAVYMQLGELERNDTLAAARFIQTKSYVDPDRISIWGWSYGGFLSSFVLSTQESRVFQSGVAVAPVTDWRYYDSIYTERYMGMPDEKDNLIGYEYTSVLNYAANIPDDSFLLIHGTGDDNVHFQNSAQLVEVLTEAGVKFEMQIYTDKHHALEGVNIHKHLYNLLTDFFKDKLKL